MLITSLTVMILMLYTLIAGFALFMTYHERKSTGNTSVFYTVLSSVACLAWPVTVVVVALTALALQRRASPPVRAAAEVSTAS